MKITVDIPDHLADKFLSWMSGSGEQTFMEIHDGGDWDADKMEYIDATTNLIFEYPGWKDQIVIKEIPREE